MDPQNFIDKYSQDVIDACDDTPLFPSVAMAQLALETGWGASIDSENNNLFGIKANGNITPFWDGTEALLSTEEDNGGEHSEDDYFRVYSTPQDSIKDHTYFLQTNSRYASAFTAITPEEQANALQDAGYSTDPVYADKLISIILHHNLKNLDKKKDSSE